LIRGTLYGGALANSPGLGGVVYSVKPDGTGYTVVHALTDSEGIEVEGQIQPSLNGGEFGIAKTGGANGEGSLFYIGAGGGFEVVHNFGGSDGGGSQPNELIEDAFGNLYGSTYTGGTGGHGVIFEYAQKTERYSVLYTFQNGADGRVPFLGAVGPDGSLYGVTQQGSSENHGALFSLTHANGQWSFAVLTPLQSAFKDDYPINPPALSSTGDLVGAMGYGGIYQFQNGQYTIKYANPTDTYAQYLSPHLDPNIILGTSYAGGESPCAIPGIGGDGCGFIFEFGQ
jgi:uncharacterized repeat protein (TIGR03803 family)